MKVRILLRFWIERAVRGVRIGQRADHARASLPLFLPRAELDLGSFAAQEAAPLVPSGT